MKKLLYLLLLLCLGNIKVYAIDLDIMSNNAILYNLDEDSILYEKDSESEIPIASMTKIMTSIIVVENVENLDDKITLTNADFLGLAEANASVAGFRVGETVTYKDLLYGLLLPSGADAAQALTRALGGRETFVMKMNDKAKELGLSHTHFINETGLDSDGHYSSVKDVATMFKYALNIPSLKDIFLHDKYTTSDNLLTFKSTILTNKNKYNLTLDYILGGKTGTTDNAGLCLASFANYNNVNYLLITARAYDNTYKARALNDAKIIYEYFMNNYANQEVIKENEELLKLDTLYAKENSVSFFAPTSYTKYLENNWNKDDLKIEYNGIDKIRYDTEVGTTLGVASIYYLDTLLTTYDIVLTNELHFDLKLWLKANPGIVMISILVIFGLLYVIIFSIRKKIKKNS